MTDKEKLEKLKKLADAMYYAAQYLTTDASGLHKAMDEYHKFIINEYHKEKPVSDFTKALAECINQAQCAVVDPMAHAEIWKEELLELAKDKEPVSEDLEKAIDTYLATYFGGEKEKQDWPFLKKMAIHFANWQKEQIMAKAVEGDITFDYYGDDDKTYGCIAHDSFCLEDFGLKDRDKVKIIVIKED